MGNYGTPVSVRKNKNQNKPLEEYVGQSPGVRLPLWSYKSKLLTPKTKACHHLLAEGTHSLQGDKPYDKLWLCFKCRWRGGNNGDADAMNRVPTC